VAFAAPNRTRDPEGTIDKLTDAALRLFAEAGYERATVDRIVAEAGFSKGAFYAHFKSKEELFLHILEQRLDRNLRRVQALCRLEGSARAWLKHVLGTLLSFASESKSMRSLSMEYMANGMRHPEIGARIATMHRRWRDLFADTLRCSPEYEQGRLKGSPEAIAYALVAMIDGFIVQIGMESDPRSKETLMSHVAPLLDAWFDDGAVANPRAAPAAGAGPEARS
jgi:AcrR family transcriptional regulator